MPLSQGDKLFSGFLVKFNLIRNMPLCYTDNLPKLLLFHWRNFNNASSKQPVGRLVLPNKVLNVLSNTDYYKFDFWRIS